MNCKTINNEQTFSYITVKSGATYERLLKTDKVYTLKTATTQYGLPLNAYVLLPTHRWLTLLRLSVRSPYSNGVWMLAEWVDYLQKIWIGFTTYVTRTGTNIRGCSQVNWQHFHKEQCFIHCYAIFERSQLICE